MTYESVTFIFLFVCLFCHDSLANWATLSGLTQYAQMGKDLGLFEEEMSSDFHSEKSEEQYDSIAEYCDLQFCTPTSFDDYNDNDDGVLRVRTVSKKTCEIAHV